MSLQKRKSLITEATGRKSCLRTASPPPPMPPPGAAWREVSGLLELRALIVMMCCRTTDRRRCFYVTYVWFVSVRLSLWDSSKATFRTLHLRWGSPVMPGPQRLLAGVYVRAWLLTPTLNGPNCGSGNDPCIPLTYSSQTHDFL